MLRYATTARGCVIARCVRIKHDNVTAVVRDDCVARVCFVAITIGISRMKGTARVFCPIRCPSSKVPSVRHPRIRPDVLNVGRAYDFILARAVSKTAPSSCVIYCTGTNVISLFLFNVCAAATDTGPAYACIRREVIRRYLCIIDGGFCGLPLSFRIGEVLTATCVVPVRILSRISSRSFFDSFFCRTAVSS